MKGAVVDLDGTVYLSTDPVDGAVEGIEILRNAGVDVAFVSNTSTKSRETCLERLRRIGIDAEIEDVLTSASVTASYVAETYPDATVYAVGQPTLIEELTTAGLELTNDPDAADVLVVGKDRSFDFETIDDALQILERGAPFVVTNRDRTAPTSDGIEPGSGAVVESIAYAADREPDVVAGKPHDPMIETTLDRLGVPAEECIVVGDNPESDIAMGERAGMTTVLVLSGVATRSEKDARPVEADYVVESMGDLAELLDALETE